MLVGMHIPRSALAIALVACALGVGSMQPIAAQDAPAPATSAESEAALLRTRGGAGWRSYVWSLDRTRLTRMVSDLEESRRIGGGEADFTQIYLIAYGNLVLGHTEAGVRATAEARRRAPTYPGLLLLDAFAATLEEDSASALRALDRFVDLIEAANGDPEFRFLGRLHRGVQFFETGAHDRAIEDLEVAIAIAREADRKPPNEAVLRLALAHQRVQQFAAAEKLVRGMLAQDPANAYLYYNLGLLYGTQNDFEKARRWYERASRRRRHYADPHVKLAFLAWKQAAEDPDQLVRMREHLEAYVDLIGPKASVDARADAESGLGSYWFAIAEQREIAGHERLAKIAYDRAREHFAKALEYRPECLRALSMLVRIAFVIGLPEDEVRRYKELLDEIESDGMSGPEAYRSTFC